MYIRLVVCGSVTLGLASACGGKSEDNAVAMAAGGTTAADPWSTTAAGHLSGGAPPYVFDDTWNTGGVPGMNSAAQLDADAGCVSPIAVPVDAGTLADCSIDVTVDPDTMDPTKVNVMLLSHGSTSHLFCTPDGTGATCGTLAHWYFDNWLAPQKLLLCPVACEELKADPGCELKIAFGCDLVPKIN